MSAGQTTETAVFGPQRPIGTSRRRHIRPVRPWQHWRFAVTVTVCWVARRHFLALQRTSAQGYRFYRCRVCRSNVVVRGGK